MKPILYYIHDPMCSWCWAFSPVLQKIKQQMGSRIQMQYLLGGLAPDSDAPMPQQMQDFLQTTWKTIQQRVPGTQFNFDFWQQCQPRRSTYPACRAVIAAKEQGREFESAMILGIQQAYYLQAQNPSDNDTLIAVAEGVGLNPLRFTKVLMASSTQEKLEQEIGRARQMGVNGFPSLVLDQEGQLQVIQHDYLDSGRVIEQLELAGIESAG